MRFAVVTLGSAGDLHPFLAMARELTSRGHDVQLLSQAPYKEQVEREGVQFRSVVPVSDHERTLTHPLLWHPVDGFGVLWRHLCVPAIEATCEALGELAHAHQEPLRVFASPLAVGARFALDRWPTRIRLRSGYTAPMGLRDVADPMFLGGWKVPTWLPRPTRRGLWQALDRWKLEPMARPALTQWQHVWRTPPIGASVFGDWLHAPGGGLALYPEWFAPVPDQWRLRGVIQSGFPIYEPRAPAPLSADLLAFLARHGRPVVVYPGSAAGEPHHFLDLALAACHELALPAVVLAPHLHSVHARAAAPVASGVITVEQASLSLLLPGCSALVHHGGIGSVAQAISHQLPQLILASAYDQFENGARVANLLKGRSLALRKATRGDVLEALRSISTMRFAPNTTTVSGAEAVAKGCDWLEALE